MATAAHQRLKRTQIPEQMALDIDIPAALDLRDPAAHAREQDDFVLLADEIAKAQPQLSDPWRDSPFQWFKRLPPARRATAGQALLSRWLNHCGVSHGQRHGEGDHDLLVTAEDGRPVRVQVRISTRWSEGDFIFQGIKAGQYDTLALLGIAPHHARLWAVPQRDALAHAEGPGWLTVPEARPPAWLGQFGGTLTGGTRELVR